MSGFFQDNSITIGAVAFAVQVATGMLAQAIAERKGHSRRWFWAGFLLPLVGVVWAAGLQDETLRAEMRAMRGNQSSISGDALPLASAPACAAEDGEIIAVIAAALTACGEQPGAKYVLRSFRPAGRCSTAWTRAGRGRF